MENKKMSKYKEAIGIWKHTIGEITHELVPHEEDNYRFLKAKDEAVKNNSTEILNRKIGNLYFEMVIRAYPELDDVERTELKSWIGINIGKISEDFMVAFRWTTVEKLNAAKKKLNLEEEETK